MGFYSPAVPVQDAQLHGLRPHQRFRLVGVALSNFRDPGDRPAQTALFTQPHSVVRQVIALIS